MRGSGLKHPKKAGLSGLFLYAVLAIALLAATGRALAAPLTIEIVAARPAYYKGDSKPLISFKMSEASRASFAELTRKNIGRKLALRIDGKVVSTPVIREPITGGAGQILADFSAEQARDIARRLNAGTAKLEVEIVD